MKMAVLISALLAGAASAQSPPPSTPETPANVTVRGPERLVCRAVVRTATRMRAARQCRPASQWSTANRQSNDEALDAAGDTLDALGADDAGTNDQRNPMDTTPDTPLGPR